MSAGNNISIAANQITESDSRYNRKNQEISNCTTTQQGSTVTAGENLVMIADNNLNVTASSVSVGNSALLSADNDLNAAREGENHRNGKSESHESHAAVSTVTAGSNLTLA